MSARPAYLPRACPRHPGDHACYICLDPACDAPSATGCAHCVRESHARCGDDLLVEDREFHARVDTRSLQVPDDLVRADIDRAVERAAARLRQSLRQVQPAFLRARADLARLAPDDLPRQPRLKDRCAIAVDPRSAVLRLAPKALRSEAELAANLELLQARLALAFRGFAGVSSLAPQRAGSRGLDPADWAAHKDIAVTAAGGGLRFQRLKEDPSSNYFAAVQRTPLGAPARVRMTVESIHESDRFLDFGVLRKPLLASALDSLTVSFNSGAVSFCGYSQSAVEGKMPTSSSSSPEGFKPGDAVTLELVSAAELRFANDDLSVDLSTKALDEAAEYHLFVVLYYADCACTLERLA